MLNIKNFRKSFRTVILQRGRDYYNQRRITSVTHIDPDFVEVTVKGSKEYTVELTIEENGDIIEYYCDCPYSRDYDDPCKHVAAVLYMIEESYTAKIENKTSGEIRSLIKSYQALADISDNISAQDKEKIKIIPELHTGSSLLLSLKIGRDKLYKVRNILKLYYDFRDENFVRYGKALEFFHRIDVLDERSKRLLEIAFRAYSSQSYYFRNDDSAALDNIVLDDFFELFRDEYVLFDGENHLVKFEDPRVNFTITREKNGIFKLMSDNFFTLIGRGRRACFRDKMNKNFFIASPEFTKAVYELYRVTRSKTLISVSEKDMPEFYNAVLKPVSEYALLRGMELIEEFVPPEMSAQLYIDCGEDNVIYGKLTFAYGDKIYNAFADRDNPHYDRVGEKAAENAVLRYFAADPFNERHQLFIGRDDNIYEFVTSGISELSKTMELYISDRFRRIAVRPPFKPVVSLGLRPGGGLLELSIEDSNYSPEELTEVLKAYRTGAKYHRLRDGSFVLPDSSMSELCEVIENLNVSEKDILKKDMKIPAYRMLYLDSLKKAGNIRLHRSNEFKNAVKNYHAKIENAENAPVPDELSGIMRDYQEYGFRWLKTVSSYGFGGILADDMGLGKTIQAISLMLDEKKNSDAHKTNLIVCPSSLTLNWESEITRFAPQLKTLVVIGTAAVRSKLTEQIADGEYDAVITSYSALIRDVDKYENIKFGLHFIDEAQYIKNHNTQASKAVKGICSEHRFALTGTPVENSLAELWSIFDFIMPGYLFGYTHFKKNFEMPVVSKQDSKAAEALKKNVSPFILRRLKKDVLEELPEKTETTLTSLMTAEQQKLYTANIVQIKKNLKNGMTGSPTDKIQILAMLTRLRQICCDPHLVYENYSGGSAKLEQCIELVESCAGSGHKMLLFSQFTSMLDIIENKLDEAGISYCTLTGSTKAKDRIRMVNEFNGNDVKVFLISLKAGGTGLNLTGADIVIHYDPWWNISGQDQASDRAYRIGQKRSVQVYKLIAHNSIEENILKLQQSKSKLNEFVSGGEADITKMSAEEILRILE